MLLPRGGALHLAEFLAVTSEETIDWINMAEAKWQRFRIVDKTLEYHFHSDFSCFIFDLIRCQQMWDFIQVPYLVWITAGYAKFNGKARSIAHTKTMENSRVGCTPEPSEFWLHFNELVRKFIFMPTILYAKTGRAIFGHLFLLPWNMQMTINQNLNKILQHILYYIGIQEGDFLAFLI